MTLKVSCKKEISNLEDDSMETRRVRKTMMLRERKLIKVMQTNRFGQWEVYHIIERFRGHLYFIPHTEASCPSQRKVFFKLKVSYMPFRVH